MKKLSWKERIFNKDVLIAILVILGLSIHFYYFNNLIFTKQESSNWINVINSIILLITLTAFSGFILTGLFSLITHDAESVEKWALRNLTKVCYFIALLLISSLVFRYLTTEQFLTSFGALIVFWYGYKKYETEKEIQLIQYFSEKYNKINYEIKNSEEYNEDLMIARFSELINLWYSEFHLWKQGYISDSLWNDWEYWIKSDTFIYIDQGRAGYSDRYGYKYQLEDAKVFDIYFLKALNGNIGFFKFSKEKKYGTMSWKDFLLMLQPTISDCHKMMQKHTKEDIKQLGSFKYINELFIALESDLK